MKHPGSEPIISDGQERHRAQKEREIRQELLRKDRHRLENAGPIEGLLLRTRVLLAARKAARDASQRAWYLGV